ncbi:MAG: HAMP domain-containing protein, partial [Candidatus Binatia bacterium]
PILDKRGAVAGVVFATIDLAWFNQIVSAAELPDRSTLTLYDRRGTVIAYHPEAEQWVGKRAGESQIFRTVFAEAEGVTEALGLDGKRRLYGFISFGAAPNKHDIYLAVGIPANVALAGADWTLHRNLVALLLVSALALMAAWYVGDALILRPLSVLINATARVGAGNLSTRTGLPPGDGEVGRLAASFDKMAESLEFQKAEADLADLRTKKSLERIKALHEIDVAITSTLDLQAILEVVLQKIDVVLPKAVTTIRLIDKESGEVAPVACKNIDEEYWRAGNHKNLHGLAKEVLENKLPVTMVDMQENPATQDHQFIERFGLVSYLGMPLVAKGELQGLNAYYTRIKNQIDV